MGYDFHLLFLLLFYCYYYYHFHYYSHFPSACREAWSICLPLWCILSLSPALVAPRWTHKLLDFTSTSWSLPGCPCLLRVAPHSSLPSCHGRASASCSPTERPPTLPSVLTTASAKVNSSLWLVTRRSPPPRSLILPPSHPASLYSPLAPRLPQTGPQHSGVMGPLISGPGCSVLGSLLTLSSP